MRTISMAGNRRQASAHTLIRTRAKCAALAMLALLALLAPGADAQGSRKDDVVFGPGGHPVAGATVTVFQASATGTPCAPLATIYTDATLSVPAANPLQTDGIGNYHFYAPAGRYVLQISGPGISGTLTYRDVILAPDVSSSSSGNNISAFGLTLGGNLSVAGNAAVNGTLAVGGSTTFSGPLNINAANTGNVAGKPASADAIEYVTTEGNDANDGLSWGTAKKTIMAGYDALPSAGGTVFVSSNIVSPVSCTATPGQGIWLMGALDPNYANPPAGWRHVKSVRFIGVGSQDSSAQGSMPASFINCGSGVGKRGIWISSSATTVSFENFYIAYPEIAVQLGVDSNGTQTANSGVVSATFDHMLLFVCNSCGATGAGPGVYIGGGNSFDIYINNSVVQGNPNATPGSDIQSAVLVHPTSATNAVDGLIFIDRTVLGGGGIKAYGGVNPGSLYVSNTYSESIAGGSANVGTVWYGNGWTGTVQNIGTSDATGAVYDVRVDAPSLSQHYPLNLVTAIGNFSSGILGPVALAGSDVFPAVRTKTEFEQQHIGTDGYLLSGATNAAKSLNGLSSVRFTTQSDQTGASWAAGPNTTITQNEPDPAGGNRAVRISVSSGTSYATFTAPNHVYAVGDYIVAAVAVRGASANGAYFGGYAVFNLQIMDGVGATSFSTTGFASDGAVATTGAYSGFGVNPTLKGDGEWDYIWLWGKIGVTSGANEYLQIAMWTDSTHPMDYFSPMILYVPASSVSSDNEVAAMAANLGLYAQSCAVGTLCGLPGEAAALNWLTMPETTAPSTSAGNDACYADSTAHAVKCSYNNGSFLNVPQVIASGASTLGTTAISATSCASVVTTTATGTATTDAIQWSFNAAPGTGYTAGLHVLPYVTSGNVNFLVCNPTAGSLTPAAATLNWRVVR